MLSISINGEMHSFKDIGVSSKFEKVMKRKNTKFDDKQIVLEIKYGDDKDVKAFVEFMSL